MNLRLMNLWLLIFWAFLGVTLLFREWVMPRHFQAGRPAPHLDTLGYLAMGLAGWNLVRLWMMRMAQRRREATEYYEAEYRRSMGPLVPKDPPPVVHPEFSFEEPPAVKPAADSSAAPEREGRSP
jgi:hypothetical protein